MVCLVSNDSVKDNIFILDESKTSENMNNSISDDNLKIKRIAGGSIVKYPPLFSSDGEQLFIICRNIIQIYSSITGELIRNLEGSEHDIISMDFDRFNSNIFLVCNKYGELISWKYKTGAIKSKIKIDLDEVNIEIFHLINLKPDTMTAFVTYTKENSKRVHWNFINVHDGKKISINIKLPLKTGTTKIDSNKKDFYYMAITQKHHLYVINYKTGVLRSWLGAHKIPLTFVRCHPTEELVATGDEIGRIFLWRQIFQKGQPYTNLYHWHHTPVTSISFTESGTGFFSSGNESVLVKWNMERPDLKQFLPRTSDIILHTAVSNENRKSAICTADNGIQILGVQNEIKCLIQNFTFVSDDKTNLNKYPIGLKFDPRTNCLALNGRIGHIQFYSTYTNSLLYNMDIVLQNKLSIERNKILYNIRVTHLALNIDWMVTGEIWDDQEYPCETRLKFWYFDKENQNYKLNTNVELAHYGGFTAMEFSNQFESENLYCATAGDDNCINMWTLEQSDYIKSQNKVWSCLGKLKYKDFPIKSINFSQDGSLLAAGFGNALCIYNNETLQIKTVLSAPGGLDGTVAKYELFINEKIKNKTIKTNEIKKNSFQEMHKKIIEFSKSFRNNKCDDFVKEIKFNNGARKIEKKKIFKNINKLDNKQKELIFKTISLNNDLNLFQKIDLYQKLEIYCSVPNEMRPRLINYIEKNILKYSKSQQKLKTNINKLSSRYKFKAKYKLYKYLVCEKHNLIEPRKNLVSLMELLNLNNETNTSNSNIISNGYHKIDDSNEEENGINHEDKDIPVVPLIPSIQKVLFATGEYAHLIVVCTEHRVLIWDILTLRIKSILKISVESIAIDPLTSLIATFTKNNELYIFFPNAPIPIYQRTNLPEIFGAAWVPRKVPKQQSISLDWQAISTLYFLTDDQELMCLVSHNESDLNSYPSVSMAPSEHPQSYSTFGSYLINQTKEISNENHSQPFLEFGKSGTKLILEMPTYGMAPLSKLSSWYLKSMLPKVSHENLEVPKKQSKNISEETESDDETFDDDLKQKIQLHKLNSKLESGVRKTKDEYTREEEEELQSILNEKFEIEFS